MDGDDSRCVAGLGAFRIDFTYLSAPNVSISRDKRFRVCVRPPDSLWTEPKRTAQAFASTPNTWGNRKSLRSL